MRHDISEAERQRHLAEIAEQGYTIVPDAIEVELVDALNVALFDLERRDQIVPGHNAFEGHHTIRIYNLLARGAAFAEVPVHRNVLPIVEGVLDDGCLVSSLSSISIDPGEKAQPLHADDTLMGIERPHVPLVCNSMWALTDFTEENGATRIVPGSHRWSQRPIYGAEHPSIAAEMKCGSVLIWNGSLWHGGGANRSTKRRVGIAMNYCAGFIRQQENQQLGIPLVQVRQFPPRLQQLVGFGTYKHLIGHIDKASPSQRLLGVDDSFRSVWDVIDVTTTRK
ncbi:MAG: phytanoyl-CoA dioxygenase family protein [Proteobacteria bacterium]|nr:phytanoyl-CoA dioxygenase family protein [Pseudomonadota bacterium]